MLFTPISPVRRKLYTNIFLAELLIVSVVLYVLWAPHTEAPTTEVLNPVSSPDVGSLVPENAGQVVLWETIEKGQNSAFAVKRNYVIRAEIDWKNIWASIHASITPVPPLPSVDFNSYTVAAVFNGQQPTSGYDIEIIRAIETEQAIKIYIRETEPGPHTIVTQARTQPYYIIKIPRTNKQIIFESRE